jgi:hypothetical protein
VTSGRYASSPKLLSRSQHRSHLRTQSLVELDRRWRKALASAASVRPVTGVIILVTLVMMIVMERATGLSRRLRQ